MPHINKTGLGHLPLNPTYALTSVNDILSKRTLFEAKFRSMKYSLYLA